MKRLVLHIGSAKCGSSSIQGFLGDNLTQVPARINARGESVAYAAIMGERVLLGDELIATQKRSAGGYVVSSGLQRLKPDSLTRTIAQLVERTQDIDVVVLSCEGWNVQGRSECVRCFFSAGVPIDLVLVTRPPVEMMNAAFWQWGAWSGEAIDRWCKTRSFLGKYMYYFAMWTAPGGVERELVVDISEDPILRIAEFLGFSMSDFPPPRVLNTATDARLLMHLVRNREHYQRKIHTPQVEFNLNRILKLSGERPPFVIPAASAKFLMQLALESSEILLEKIRLRGGELAPEVIRKYRDVDYYADVAAANLDDVLARENTDEFVLEVIDKLLSTRSSLDIAQRQLDSTQRALEEAERQLAEIHATPYWVNLRDAMLGTRKPRDRD